MVHVTIVGFLRSSCRTIAVRHDVCGAWLWKKIASLCLFTVQPSPTDQTKQANWPTRTNQPLTNQKPTSEIPKIFFWLKPPHPTSALPTSINQPTPRPTNPWKEWCTVGTWPCLRELGRTTSHRTALRGGRWWLWWLGMAQKKKICNANSQKFLRDHVLLNCFFLRWNWEDTFCLRCDFFRA